MKLPLPGPGAVVAAAFIGPGTVTTCTVAGTEFGYALVWALVFATLATVILQDMPARLGAGARLGLGEALIGGAGNPLLKAAGAILVLLALAVGNAAYEAGNLSGGALGIEAALGTEAFDRRIYVVALGLIAAALLLHGRYLVLERVLIGLVGIMSLAFALAFFLVRPDWAALLAGLKPDIPADGLLTVIALIGTTIVPYNLFLHAAAARARWKSAEGLAHARADTRFSIGVGGLVSIFILSTAAATLFGTGARIDHAGDMARAIEPVFGPAARYPVAVGLFAAGLTSAITAPMAAAYALTEMLPARFAARSGLIFRATALTILTIGVLTACLNIRPVTLIVTAQFANGLLLPIVAVFLLIAMNRKDLLGAHRNGPLANVLGGLVVLVTFGLGLTYVLKALGAWG
ncbi:MAG: Nramp family divalent metal transporter [Alphaproteobacteria bacterium]